MLSRKLTPRRKAQASLKYLRNSVFGRPVLINLEVTKRCNARCNFCDYWKTKDETALKDYLPLLEHLKPVVVSLTGGEPLIRKDIVNIVRNISSSRQFFYIVLITNGALLTEQKALALYEAGLDQLSISLDFIGEQHDKDRGIPGLYKHIADLIPRLKGLGCDNIALNIVIKKDNLSHIIPIVDQAKSWGVSVGLSSYSTLKTNNCEPMLAKEDMGELREVISKLRNLRWGNKHILTSDFYLLNVESYFHNKALGGCPAGKRFIQVTPEGYVKPCSELPVVAHWTEYDTKGPQVQCDKCWYSCRGEIQAPLSLKRVAELVR